jgi:hypothetical protein
MQSGHDPLREYFILGDVTPVIAATLRCNRLTWSVNRYASTLAGTTVSDDYHDPGRKILWGDVAVDGASAKVLRLCNPAAYGGSSAWYAAVNDNDLDLVTGGPTSGQYRRCGVIGTTADTWRVFYINNSDQLYYRDIQASGSALTWTGTISNAGTLPASSGSGMSVSPVSATQCFVVGYKDPVVWIRLYTYLAGAWYASGAQILGTCDSMNWAEGLWLQAIRISGTDRWIVVLPAGPGGQCQSYVYELATGVYTPANFILATPGDDFLRRVWLSGLSGPYNGRYWGVVYSDVEGDEDTYYAAYTGLVSTADGISWRDEGYVTSLDIRGKLLIVSNTPVIASSTSHLSTSGIYRLGLDTAAQKHTITNLVSLQIDYPGQNAVPQAMLTLHNEDTALARPGALLDITVGVEGVEDSITIFAGYLDQPITDFAFNKEEQRWLARGKLSRLIGESAYQPVTTLDWRGRSHWYTNFQINNVAVTGLVIYSGESYWLSEVRPADGRFNLKCTKSGTAIVPGVWHTDDLFLRCRFQTEKDAGFVFYVAEDNQADTDRWELGVRETNLQIAKLVDGMRTVVATATATSHGYTVNTEATLLCRLTAGAIQGWLQTAEDVWDVAQVSYTGWTETGGETGAKPAGYAVGLFADPGISYEAVVGGGLIEHPQEAHFYEMFVCDGGVPLTLGDALTQICDVAGVTVKTAYSLEESSAWPCVATTDVLAHLELVSDGLYLFDTLASGTGGTVLSLGVEQATLGTTNGVEYYAPYASTLDIPNVVRVVVNDDCLSCYCNSRLLCAFHVKVPPHKYYIRGYGSTTITMRECYQPVQSGNSGWMAWSAGQPISAILQSLLNGRRVYFFEGGDGEVTVRTTPESGDVLIDDEHLVGESSGYDLNVVDDQSVHDLRGMSSIIGVSDAYGGRAYVLDTNLATYNVRATLADNPWITRSHEALHEAYLLMMDNRRTLETREFTGLWDPAMEIGDRFWLADWVSWPEWEGLIRAYSVRFQMTERGAAHQATIQAWKYIAPTTASVWGSFNWGQNEWG